MQAAVITKTADLATQWIYSFVLVAKKQIDQHVNYELCICLDPSNFNIARQL